jgi:phage N-6-adenine-methyltransferase
MTRTNNTNLKDVWQTPDKITDMLQPIDLDPCAGIDTDIGRDENLTADDNGLTSEWHGRVFVNPPFSEKELWLQKSIDEKNNTEAIMVVTPDSTDTKSWWHEYIAKKADYIWFSKGRISYVVPKSHANQFPKYDGGEKANSPTFGTAISIFGEPGEKTLRRLQNNGQLLQSYEP